MPIEYTTSLNNIHAAMLCGFFDGWPNPPSPETHLRILHGSSHVVLAIDTQRKAVVGFINAISDGFHCAFIPLLEVLPEYHNQGIGSELVKRMLAQLDGFYAIDVSCDADVQPFYERFGLTRSTGVMRRDFDCQSGLPTTRK